MKNTILFLLCFSVYGCSIVPKCPEGSHIITKEEYPKITTPDSICWSIVSYNNLTNLCHCQMLCYRGSFEQYHLVMLFAKVRTIPEQEFTFAIPWNQFMPDSIFQYEDRETVPEKYKFQKVIKERHLKN
jgi:hypothetical protein